ncbi:175_t:CDS:2, partial [Cetraspora pellucida]
NSGEQMSPLAPLIQKQRTVAIHNRKHSISKKFFRHRDSINTASPNKTIIRSELEKLFAKKQTNWKRCEFVK